MVLKLKKALCVSLVALLLFSSFAFSALAAKVTQPGQPASGPNGSDYLYDCKSITYNSSVLDYSTIIMPSDSQGQSFPVIAFLHGWWATDATANYKNLLEHIAKKGFIVISLNYQVLTTPAAQFAPNAATQILEGIAYLHANPSTCPQPATAADSSILFGLIGHSGGAMTSINLAASYSTYNLPKPLFVVSLQAGTGDNAIPMSDFSKIDPDTNIIITMAEADDEGVYTTSKAIWDGISQVPATNKQWIELFSDAHGSPGLEAAHFWPSTTDVNTDALDFYGSYKWCVAIANYSFFGTNKEYWYGGTDEQLYMGTWSDGVEVKRPTASATESSWGQSSPVTLWGKIMEFFRTFIATIRSWFIRN